MRRLTNILISILLTILFLSCLNCKNPFKEEKKKQEIIILVDDYLIESGRYILFWDGKDKNKKYIEPGKYIVFLEIKDWQDQEFITAETGGKVGKNNKSRFEPGFWYSPDLEEPFPNPFQIKSGVNIPVLISEPSRVKLTIFKD